MCMSASLVRVYGAEGASFRPQKVYILHIELNEH